MFKSSELIGTTEYFVTGEVSYESITGFDCFRARAPVCVCVCVCVSACVRASERVRKFQNIRQQAL
jgi:hypothetical protein